MYKERSQLLGGWAALDSELADDSSVSSSLIRRRRL